MAALPPKTHLREQLARALATDLSLRERAHRAASEAATHAEAKPENDKDTRALEQSYLAHGEARRVEELRAALAEVQAMAARALGEHDAVVLGSLVTIDDGGVRALLWLAPHGGGRRLADGLVQVVTPKSPLGQALIGKHAGDACSVALAGRERALTIVAVA
ncbi:MAG TPA: GreA/GreB family elongation factor [Polyangiaceae bacterium]|nr:GreA/GreB family elongation factor [Polyangiaceae bacterium]